MRRRRAVCQFEASGRGVRRFGLNITAGPAIMPAARVATVDAR